MQQRYKPKIERAFGNKMQKFCYNLVGNNKLPNNATSSVQSYSQQVSLTSSSTPPTIFHLLDRIVDSSESPSSPSYNQGHHSRPRALFRAPNKLIKVTKPNHISTFEPPNETLEFSLATNLLDTRRSSKLLPLDVPQIVAAVHDDNQKEPPSQRVTAAQMPRTIGHSFHHPNHLNFTCRPTALEGVSFLHQLMADKVQLACGLARGKLLQLRGRRLVMVRNHWQATAASKLICRHYFRMIHLAFISMLVIVASDQQVACGDESHSQLGQLTNREQVDARLSSRFQPPTIQLTPDLQRALLQQQSELAQQPLQRRSNQSPFDSISSAELPSEFRAADDVDDSMPQTAAASPTSGAGNGQPREQSKLAKLCQQTSSVLASVLPAPFGGHTRSILCQFFGQINVGDRSATLASAGQQRKLPSIRLAAPGNLQPLQHVGHQQHLMNPFEAESIAVLQQAQRPPVTLLATGRHPIQLVLEHQQRQLAAANQQAASFPTQLQHHALDQQQQRGQPLTQSMQSQDLKASDSIASKSVVYMAANSLESKSLPANKQHRDRSTPAPKPLIRFSAPLLVTPVAEQTTASLPSNATASNWRIYSSTQAMQGATGAPEDRPIKQPSKPSSSGNSTASLLAGSTRQSAKPIVQSRANSTTTSPSGSTASTPASDASHPVGPTARPSTTQAAYEIKLVGELEATAEGRRHGVANVSLVAENKLPQATNDTTKLGTTSTTISQEANGPNATNGTQALIRAAPVASHYQKAKTVLVGGAANHQQAQESTNAGSKPLQIGKRTSETLKATTRAIELTPLDGGANESLSASSVVPSLAQGSDRQVVNGSSSVRTIEVNAQSGLGFGLQLVPTSGTNATGASAIIELGDSSKLANGQPVLQIIKLDHQVSTVNGTQLAAVALPNHGEQKREELVIASINNLTRIAFGNQLRDTVRVINKLIDQQASLYSKSAPTNERNRQQQNQSNHSNVHHGADPMATSESRPAASKQANIMLLNPAQVATDAKKTAKQQAKAGPTHGSVARSSAEGGKSSGREPTLSASSKRPLDRQSGHNSTTSRPNMGNSTATDKRKEPNLMRQQLASKAKVDRKVKQATDDNLERKSTSISSWLDYSRAASTHEAKVTTPKATRRPTQRPTSSSARQPGGSGRKSSSIHELRRLTAVSRSLDLKDPNYVGKSWGTTATRTPQTLVTDDLDAAQAIATSSIVHKQPKFANEPPEGSATTVTQFPWLLPDKSALQSELFNPGESKVILMSNQELLSEGSKKWTHRRNVNSGGFAIANKQLAAVGSQHLGSKRKLDSLMELKLSLPKTTTTTTTSGPMMQESSTTRLPFSSGTQSRWIPSTVFVTKPQTLATSHLASTTQSIPSTTTPTTSPPQTLATLPAGSAAPPEPSRSASTTLAVPSPAISSYTSSDQPLQASTIVQVDAITTTTTTTPNVGPQRQTVAVVQGSETNQNEPTKVLRQQQMSLVDPNEARASDSISKYTTHLSETNNPNELAATTLAISTRRNQFPGSSLLPQTAQPGEFFSAETISSWPERYQTMVSRALEAQFTASTKSMMMDSNTMMDRSFETTRRNGESYSATDEVVPIDISDSVSQNSRREATTLARHRLDTTPSMDFGHSFVHEQEKSSPRATTFGLISNLPGVTILPANHKLVASSLALPTHEITSTTISDHEFVQNGTTISQLIAASIEQQHANGGSESSVAFASVDSNGNQMDMGATPSNRQTVPPYTIIGFEGPSGSPAERDHPIATRSNEIQAQTLVKHQSKAFPDANDTLGQFSSQGAGVHQLKPPYHDEAAANYGDDQLQSMLLASDPTLVLDSNQTRPLVSRKLYNLLVPKRNLATNTSSTSPQRFNLSALKYLARNLITNGKNNTPEATLHQSKGFNESLFSIYDPLNPEAAPIEDSKASAEHQTNGSSTSVRRLLELLGLGDENLDYMTINPDEHASVGSRDIEDPMAASTFHRNGSSSLEAAPGKAGLLTRANGLLNELKHLEQRRAAALLAAIRYQVPGPLVRPWDKLAASMGSPVVVGEHQLNPSSAMDQMNLIRSRLDANETTSGHVHEQYIASPGSLLPSNWPLTRAIKSAISSKLAPNRRQSSFVVDRDQLEARLNGSFNHWSTANGGTSRRLDEAPDAEPSQYRKNSTNKNDERLVPTEVRDDALEGYSLDGPQVDWHQSSPNASWLLHPENKSPKRLPARKEQDFHSINLSSRDAAARLLEVNDLKESKYVSFVEDPHPGALTGGKSSNATNKGRSGSKQTATPAARFKLSTNSEEEQLEPSQVEADVDGQNPGVAGRLEGGDRSEKYPKARSKSGVKQAEENEFNCSGRAAGFYPDAKSSCQNFHHCSTTGHLLTFNCPSQTRFDERSLKCGPWFEVPCNLDRVRAAG